jgi:RNA 2',3'-cyclic 3'-phosphodiesterase
VRAFVALEVERPGRASTAPEHLTLEFLGEIVPELVPPIATALERVGKGIAPFDLTLEGVGAFPSPARPRVVWTGVTLGRANVVDLAGRIAAALAPLGLPPPREAFEPHLTLFRVRGDRDRRRAFDLLEGREVAPSPRTTHVDRFVLKESLLDAHGATHRTLATALLEGEVPAAGP